MELLTLLLTIIEFHRLLLDRIFVLGDLLQIAVNLLLCIFELCIQCPDLAFGLGTLLDDFVALAADFGDFLARLLQLLLCILQIAFELSLMRVINQVQTKPKKTYLLSRWQLSYFISISSKSMIFLRAMLSNSSVFSRSRFSFLKRKIEFKIEVHNSYLLVLAFRTVILVLEGFELHALGLVVLVYFLLFLFCLLLLGRNHFERFVDLIDQLTVAIALGDFLGTNRLDDSRPLGLVELVDAADDQLTRFLADIDA